MSLSSYADQCSGPLAEELATTLDAADIQSVRDALAQAGRVGWLRFREDNAAAIAAFLGATPAQRRQRKAWQGCFPALVLAAWQLCQEAEALLRVASRLEPGQSYRRMAADTGQQWQTLQSNPPADWPWDDPNPFDDLT